MSAEDEAMIPLALRHRAAWTSTFLASLQVAREGEVDLDQDGLFAPIYVQRISVRVASVEIGRVGGELVPG